MDFIGGHLPELIILLVVILIIWGPGKLPDVGAAMGRGIREFRKASSETRESFRSAAADEPAKPAAAQPAPEQPAPEQPAPVAVPEPSPTPSGPSGSTAG